MIESDIIIVGGGPAGSACAWKLRQHGKQVLILDKQTFPRLKLCAGWVTPQVFRNLNFDPKDYPHSILTFKRLYFHVYGIKFPVPTRQYSIRRIEFDHWLLNRSAADVDVHEVKSVEISGNGFVIDNQYTCSYLIGAGGTHCPVYRKFFSTGNSHAQDKHISTIEEEFEYAWAEKDCHLWFFGNGLPGYAWYVPKGGGWLNVGIGGKTHTIKKKEKTIRDYWEVFTKKLNRLGLVRGHEFKTSGYTYFLHNSTGLLRNNNAFIVGDAAGLASLDMGEGIGPAIESGLLAARSILENTSLQTKMIHKYSLKSILLSR